MERWENGSAAQNLDARHYTQFLYGASVWYRVTRGFMLTLVVENSTELVGYRGESVAYGQPQNTDFLLLTNYALF